MPPEDSQFTRKVTYEQCIAVYNTEHAKWKSAIDEQTTVSEFKLQSIRSIRIYCSPGAETVPILQFTVLTTFQFQRNPDSYWAFSESKINQKILQANE